MSASCIVILGASRGLGRALAWHYAAIGWQVIAVARHFETSPNWPASIEQHQVDVTDMAQLTQLFDQLASRQQPIDLVLYNAGVYVAARHSRLSPEDSLQMLTTNTLAMQHSFALASELLLQQGYGQLAAVSSVAALLKQDPKASLYSASKRAVLAVCDAYRIGLAPFGIAVSAIMPGYIDTARLRELNGGSSQQKWFVMSEQAAAERIVPALARRQSHIVFPTRMRLLIGIANLLPSWLLQWR